MHPQVLPTLTQILALERLEHLEFDLDHPVPPPAPYPASGDRSPTPTEQQATAEWRAAIATVNQLLAQGSGRYPVALAGDRPIQGVFISSPAPVLVAPELAAQFAHWVLIPEPVTPWSGLSRQLPPSDRECPTVLPDSQSLPLLPQDPLAGEQFCLVLTAEFNLALVLGWDGGQPIFQFSFDPQIVAKAWQAIHLRLAIARPQAAQQMAQVIQAFTAIEPDYRLVAQFSRGVVYQLSQAALSANSNDRGRHEGPVSPAPTTPPEPATTSEPLDTELLQAMAHEIRTPLTTIRTLTRSLLRRTDLDAKVLQRLGQIDRECTRQIDRFSLIFRAAELETQRHHPAWGTLSATALDQVFRDSIPAWQQQASQRQIQLEVGMPSGLPLVVSEPTMLTQMLTGLIDRFTHSLPAGSHLQLDVTLAGHQLKLQFTSNLQPTPAVTCPFTPSTTIHPHQAFRAIGQLLMLQPETGNLSLNLAATKNLFQALGGKLIVKQRPEQGEVLTIFLPLSKSYSNA